MMKDHHDIHSNAGARIRRFAPIYFLRLLLGKSKMKNLLRYFLLSFFILMGCDSDTPPVPHSNPTTNDVMLVPPFVIEIKLSEAAQEKLTNAGETVKGIIYFDGDGSPLPGIKTAPSRDVVLGKYEFELETSGIIRISDATISSEAYARLSNLNYHFTVNVVSGRHVFRKNILNGYAQGRLTHFKEDHKILI
jgi:hypothetical protein